MGHFFRIRKCCFCCGNLRGGAIAIGIFYLLLALFGATVDDQLVYAGLREAYASPEGPCGEIPLLRIWQFSSLVSVFINLAMVYGALAEKALLVAPWLAWHLTLPFVQIPIFVWSALALNCATIYRPIIYILITLPISLLPLLYFATVVYSLYKDLSEGNRDNNYGTNLLLPSTNWDAAMTPYTSYDPASATPTALGSLQPQQHTYQLPTQNLPSLPPPTQPQRQKSGIPRPQSQQYVA